MKSRFLKYIKESRDVIKAYPEISSMKIAELKTLDFSDKKIKLNIIEQPNQYKLSKELTIKNMNSMFYDLEGPNEKKFFDFLKEQFFNKVETIDGNITQNKLSQIAAKDNKGFIKFPRLSKIRGVLTISDPDNWNNLKYIKDQFSSLNEVDYIELKDYYADLNVILPNVKKFKNILGAPKIKNRDKDQIENFETFLKKTNHQGVSPTDPNLVLSKKNEKIEKASLISISDKEITIDNKIFDTNLLDVQKVFVSNIEKVVFDSKISTYVKIEEIVGKIKILDISNIDSNKFNFFTSSSTISFIKEKNISQIIFNSYEDVFQFSKLLDIKFHGEDFEKKIIIVKKPEVEINTSLLKTIFAMYKEKDSFLYARQEALNSENFTNNDSLNAKLKQEIENSKNNVFAYGIGESKKFKDIFYKHVENLLIKNNLKVHSNEIFNKINLNEFVNNSIFLTKEEEKTVNKKLLLDYSFFAINNKKINFNEEQIKQKINMILDPYLDTKINIFFNAVNKKLKVNFEEAVSEIKITSKEEKKQEAQKVESKKSGGFMSTFKKLISKSEEPKIEEKSTNIVTSQINKKTNFEDISLTELQINEFKNEFISRAIYSIRKLALDIINKNNSTKN